MATILIHPTNGRIGRADVLDRFPDADVVEPDTTGAFEEVLGSLSDRCVLVTNNDSWEERYLDGLAAGDWVATTATGVDVFPMDRFEASGVALTHMPTIYAEPVSTHAFATAFAVARRLGDYRDLQADGEWDKRKAGVTDFAGDACCVVGLGRIGEAVARRAAAFGMTVRGVKRDVSGYDGAADEVYASGDLAAAMEGARLAVLVVPLTDETEGLVGADALAALEEDAIVVNVARGPVLDTDALVAALDRDGLRAACLDVFDEEPLPDDSPLWARDDVLVTPHVAGWSDKLPGRALDVFCEQYDAWTSGEERPHRIV
ncbi:MAG: D-2-hydroxyacid dehydrogenase [Haloarculaceae archaeon]